MYQKKKKMVRYALPIYNVTPGKSKYVKELAILLLERVILTDIACLIADFADDLPPLPWVAPPGYSLWSIGQPEYDQQGHYGYLPSSSWDENNFAADF